MEQGEIDRYYMRRALKLAARGRGSTSPNPMVGAVIVKDGSILAEGYHRVYGGPHAEINAIRSARAPLAGSSFYVTLEPCTHYGKTPPCIESVLAAQPAEVIIGTTDPNPLVAGRGIKLLEKNGIVTRVGILEGECRDLNEKFFKYIRSSIPFVTVKFAQSLDGRIAAKSGDSKWISSEPSRRLAHRERAWHDAVLVGAGTVLADDPELTVRLARGRNPIRIVIDSKLRIPLQSRILKDQSAAKTLIVTTKAAEGKSRFRHLKEMGLEILITDHDEEGHVDLGKLLPALGKRRITSILVEGGSETITSFLKNKFADRLLVFTAPKLIGKGFEAVGDLGIDRIREALRLDIRRVFRSSGDIVVDARFLSSSPQNKS